MNITKNGIAQNVSADLSIAQAAISPDIAVITTTAAITDQANQSIVREVINGGIMLPRN